LANGIVSTSQFVYINILSGVIRMGSPRKDC